MANKRAGGSVKNGRDSKSSKRLGIKFYKNNNSYLVLLINRLLEPKLEAVGYAEH